MKKIVRCLCAVLILCLLGQSFYETPFVYAKESEVDEGESAEQQTGDIAETDCLVTEAFPADKPNEEPGEDGFEAEDPQWERWMEEARKELTSLVEEREIFGLVYLCETYPIRENPTYDSEEVFVVESGQTVTIEDVQMDADFEVWTYVTFWQGTEKCEGYLPRRYLACSDERFLDWEARYGLNFRDQMLFTLSEEEGNEPKVSADIAQFPASYQAPLTALKEKHPNWIFVPMNTKLNWETVIDQELLGGKSLVHKSFPDYTKDGPYDQGNWFYATRDVLKQYMDPRNSLKEDTIFQFEQLTYNESYHTEKAVEAFLSKTFMNSSKNAPGTVMTFAHIFWAIGQEEGRRVSPFHLAARVYQEQGSGNSSLISGTYPGYEGYYNYFNVGASGTTTKEVVENGLSYAKRQNPPWNNAYYSILGGANVISKNYITKGQDTVYLQKYNVNPNGYYALYTHQYMQNISAPTTEGKSIYKLYASADSLDSPFVFKIPVYNNMPEKPCPAPTGSLKVSLEVPEGFDGEHVFLDGVSYTATKKDGKWVVTAPDNKAKTAIVYKYDESLVPVDMYVWTLSYQNSAYLAKAQPKLKNLFSYEGFSIRITGKSGMRVKTGIATVTKNQLTGEGIDGYKLKEYGTLVMSEANQKKYPMVKDGEKVILGMAYGTDAKGEKIDNVYEVVNGRCRFTGVLVGMPVSQYKTGFAFRGYAVLEKDGAQITLYGPVVARDIYGLAKRFVDRGSYPEGSAPDLFLRNLIKEADDLETKE